MMLAHSSSFGSGVGYFVVPQAIATFQSSPARLSGRMSRKGALSNRGEGSEIRFLHRVVGTVDGRGHPAREKDKSTAPRRVSDQIGGA